jgi:hypothetical protein
LKVNAQNLQVTVRDDDLNSPIIIPGLYNQYISIRPISKIRITCNKIGFTIGTLFALVNTRQANTLQCTSYAQLNGNTYISDSYCLTKEFVYDLALEGSEVGSYQFECRILENAALVSNTLVLQRLCKYFLI